MRLATTSRQAGIALWAIVLAVGAMAQVGPVQGLPPYRAMLGAGASIDLYSANLNATFAIPIVAKRGRAGMGFAANLVYNSSIYANNGGAFVYSDSPTQEQIAPGWALMVPTGEMGYITSSGYCSPPPPAPGGGAVPEIKETYKIFEEFYYWDPQGTKHLFPTVKLETGNSCNGGGIQRSLGSSSDGVGLSLSVALSGSGVGPATVGNTNGLTTTFSGSTQVQVEDRNGNIITDTTDTTGTQVLSTTTGTNCISPVNSDTYTSCIYYNVAQPGGGTQTYSVYLEQTSLNTYGYCTGITDFSAWANLPAQIVLPQFTPGSHWYYNFQYGSSGQVGTITWPGGGSTSFNYGSLCTYGDGTPASMQIIQNDSLGHQGITTYTRTSASQTTVTNNVNTAGETVVTYNSAGQPSEIQEENNGIVARDTQFDFSGAYPSKVFLSLDGVTVDETDLTWNNGLVTQETGVDWGRDQTGNTKRIVNTTYYAYDRPSEIKVTDGGGAVYSDTTFAYDNYAAPSELVASSGASEHDPAYSTSYTNRDNPTSVSQWVSSGMPLTTYFGYEDTGNVVLVQQANGNRLALAYGACGDTYLTSQSAPGGAVQFGYDCPTGLLTSATDQNNAVTSYGYDNYMRPSSVSYPDGGGATFAYPDPNDVETTTKITSSVSLTNYRVLDGFGRTVYDQTENPAASWDTVETVYDGLGEVVQRSLPYATGHAPSPASSFTTTSYDGIGRPVSVTAPDGSATTMNYTRDAVESTDPRGVKKILEDDGFGRLWRVCEVTAQAGNGACGLPIAASGFLTTYDYNPDDDLIQVQQMAQTNPVGQTRSWAYDWLGRPLSISDPESGATIFTYDSVSSGTCGSGGSSSSQGDLVFRQNAAGQAICLKYDPWHRLLSKLDSTGGDFEYRYDGSAASHSLGRLASASGGSGLSWIYDAMGRPTQVNEDPGTGSRATNYAYNLAGEIASIGAPSGISLNYSYDSKARLTAITNGATPILASRSYNPADQVTAENLGAAGGQTQLAVTESYNNMDQPWELTFAPQQGGGFTEQYQWGANFDSSGNVTSKDNNGTLRVLADLTAPGRTMTYGYDDLNRISSAVAQDNAISVNFTIDPYGNRDAQTGTLKQSFSASTATNRISSFGYDAAGRLTSGTWGSLPALRSFGWSPEDQLMNYFEGTNQVASFTHGPLGRRGEQAPTGGTPSYYFYGANPGGHPLAEYTTSWQTDVVADGRTIATLDASGNPTFLGLDALGTARQTVNSAGSASGIARYYPYGEEQTGLSSEYKYTNQQRDPNGTDHFAFRTYSSDLARWLSPDPAGAAAVDPADPQSWDRYSYLGNQPTMLADPLGLAPCPKGYHSGANPDDAAKIVAAAKSLTGHGIGYSEPSDLNLHKGNDYPISVDCSTYVRLVLNRAGGPALAAPFTTRDLVAADSAAGTGGKGDGAFFTPLSGPAAGALALIRFANGTNHVVILDGKGGFYGSQSHSGPANVGRPYGLTAGGLKAFFHGTNPIAVSFLASCMPDLPRTAAAAGGGLVDNFGVFWAVDVFVEQQNQVTEPLGHSTTTFCMVGTLGCK